jgi:hypothetical protein
MKYLCLICAEKVMEQMPRADADKHFEEYRAFTDVIRQSGHYLGCNRLLPPDAATTVRVRNGRVSVTDGPWIETKDQLGGYYIIEARDLNEAIQVASRTPGGEVRLRRGAAGRRGLADAAGARIRRTGFRRLKR